MKTKCGLIFLLLYVAFRSNAQVDPAFLKHLSEKGMKREHAAYLASLSTTPDSLHYLQAKFYLQYFNDALFSDHYLKSRSLFTKDSFAMNRADILYLKETPERQVAWFGATVPLESAHAGKAIGFAYLASVDPRKTSVSLLPQKLQAPFLEYRRAYEKKPVIAAALSAVVPGLGKLYIGRKKSFVNTLLTHAIYGAQSYESIKKLGIRNAFSILDLGFFSVFYLANVYGSYTDTRQVKKEKRKQFMINASDYYNMEYSSKLY
ncbi:MAG: hypothetical protein ACJ76F_07300 [Bacteroidia bacterium]